MFEHSGSRPTRKHVSLGNFNQRYIGRFVTPNFSSSPLMQQVTPIKRHVPLQNRCRMPVIDVGLDVETNGGATM